MKLPIQKIALGYQGCLGITDELPIVAKSGKIPPRFLNQSNFTGLNSNLTGQRHSTDLRADPETLTLLGKQV